MTSRDLLRCTWPKSGIDVREPGSGLANEALDPQRRIRATFAPHESRTLRTGRHPGDPRSGGSHPVTSRSVSGPRFSVVVPVLNGGRWLPATLAGLDAQTVAPDLVELLFVDNGSTDESLDLLRRHPRVRLLHEPRRDPYLARNRGIEAATGEYIVLLDVDCPPGPDWLAAYAEAIDASHAEILIGALLHPPRSPLLLKCYETYYNTKLEWLIDHRRTVNYFGHAGNMAVRRDVFSAIGLFRAMPIVGDTEILHRLLRRDPEAAIRFVAGARVVHVEVDSVRSILGKLVDIGGYTQALVPEGDYSPLSLPDKCRIAAATVRRLPHGVLGPSALALMLGCGWAAYLVGRVLAIVKPGGRDARREIAEGSRNDGTGRRPGP